MYTKVMSSRSAKALHLFPNKYQSPWKEKFNLANTEEEVENTCDDILGLPLKNGNTLLLLDIC